MTLFARGFSREEWEQSEVPRYPTYLSKAGNLGVLRRSCIHPQSLDRDTVAAGLAKDLVIVHCGLTNVVAPSFFQKSSQAGGMVTAIGNSAPRPPDGAAKKTRGGSLDTR